ncbi:hypothetical protein MROS_0264 [Melioribacter roseus P3M-2]|uniref:Uncharacterized protein n=1 Tax=Melioribacter roseus (strain DSM 23840 / JCM 17771 / VKM B-2668 / P3M-2) TaxID=1191523 RepID=I6ZWS2_MELRP|nr:hypothetical protein [Melioribacter roseus]AFN73508.1 hypothetical protein MROS_0264 [Melioribacter roseus P3M-2]
MNLYAPNNIFIQIFSNEPSVKQNYNVISSPSPMVVKNILNDKDSIGLVPTLELVNNKELFVSSKIGISFDGILSSAYLYFVKGERTVDKIHLRGDISVNEALISNMLFEERYSVTPEIILDTSREIDPEKDYLIAGNENFVDGKFKIGLSLADEISDLLNLPYVNYLLVSKNSEKLEEFNNTFKKIDTLIEDNFEDIINALELNDEVKNYLTDNFNSIYYELTPNETEAVQELIKLVYYHGIIDDIFDVKYV